jgi:hypothetical protein
MASILVYTTPAHGHLYPIFDAVLALARRGHRICVYTPAVGAPCCRAAS